MLAGEITLGGVRGTQPKPVQSNEPRPAERERSQNDRQREGVEVRLSERATRGESQQPRREETYESLASRRGR